MGWVKAVPGADLPGFDNVGIPDSRISNLAGFDKSRTFQSLWCQIGCQEVTPDITLTIKAPKGWHMIAMGEAHRQQKNLSQATKWRNQFYVESKVCITQDLVELLKRFEAARGEFNPTDESVGWVKEVPGADLPGFVKSRTFQSLCVSRTLEKESY